MSQTALLVLTTCPTKEAAERVAQRLVEAHLAACVNAIEGVTSTYRWKGQVERDSEILLVIKTTPKAFAALGKLIDELSDYELPELLAVPVEDGSRAYLDWLFQSVRTEES